MGKGFDIRYLFTDIKNNGNFWTLTGVLLLIAVWYYTYKIEREKNNAIDKYLKKTVAYTTTCNRNIRSSMDNVKYIFFYHGKKYVGSNRFDKSIRGDICTGYRFIVEFDSTQPMNNRIILDSMITTNPIYDHRFDNVYNKVDRPELNDSPCLIRKSFIVPLRRGVTL